VRCEIVKFQPIFTQQKGTKMFDFKKEFKQLYAPKQTPQILTVPPANFVCIRGEGDPNESGGAYQRAIEVLYA